jgi:hypothetical protein
MFLADGIGATFSPKFGYSLTQAANTLGFQHFNWLQIIGPRNPVTGLLDCTNAALCVPDPPLNCYPALVDSGGPPCPNRDGLQWYLDEQFTVGGTRIYDINGNRVSNGLTRLEAWTANSTTLLFSDSPNVNASFLTCLVGVRADGTGSVFAFPSLTTNPTCFHWSHTVSGIGNVHEDVGGPSNGTSSFVGFLATGEFASPEQQVLAQLGIGITRIVEAATEPPTLDVDASLTATKYDALTDGLLIIRYLSGLTGPALTTSALGGTATRTDPAAIKTYLDGIRTSLDIDSNGTADAMTDGMLILRYLFGLRGTALIAGVVDPSGARNTATEIETYIQSLMP